MRCPDMTLRFDVKAPVKGTRAARAAAQRWVDEQPAHAPPVKLRTARAAPRFAVLTAVCIGVSNHSLRHQTRAAHHTATVKLRSASHESWVVPEWHHRPPISEVGVAAFVQVGLVGIQEAGPDTAPPR
jgi:hypothetical protein